MIDILSAANASGTFDQTAGMPGFHKQNKVEHLGLERLWSGLDFCQQPLCEDAHVFSLIRVFEKGCAGRQLRQWQRIREGILSVFALRLKSALSNPIALLQATIEKKLVES